MTVSDFINKNNLRKINNNDKKKYKMSQKSIIYEFRV